MMTETFVEKRAALIKERGIKKYHVSINWEGLAKELGVPTKTLSGMASILGPIPDFTGTDLSWDHPTVREKIAEIEYEALNIDPSRISPIYSITDQYGYQINPDHMDYQTIEEDIAWCERHWERNQERGRPLKYSIRLVLDDHVAPEEGKTQQDYKDAFENRKARYEARFEKPWPHPKDESKLEG